MVLIISPTALRRRTRARSTNTSFKPISVVVSRIAIVYFSSMSTLPVFSWVINEKTALLHVKRNNHMILNKRKYSVLSWHPYFRSTLVKLRKSFVATESRLMSHDRENGDDIDQSISPSSFSQIPSLTSEMLSLRFRDVFAHFQSLQPVTDKANKRNIIKMPDESAIRMNLLRTRHASLELDKCRIDISSVPDAGYGVYATTSITRNELITLYPGDAVIQWKHKDHMDPATDGGIQIFFGTHIPESERTTAALDNSSNSIDTSSSNRIFMNHIPTARGYEVRISDTISVIGDPNRASDPAYLGHMINDYCMIQSDDIFLASSNENEAETIRQYNIRSIQKSNCKIQVGIDQCHVEIIATRDITSGEELFLSYGSNYWLSRRTVSTRSVTTPIAKGAKNEPTATTIGKPGFGNFSGKVKTKKK